MRKSEAFETPAPVAAVIAIPAGRLQVIAAERSDTTVEIRPADATKKRDVQAAERITIAYGAGVLRIEAPEPESPILGSPGFVEVTVQVPAGSRIDAKAPMTEFRGVGRLGEVAVEGASGSIKLDEATTARLTLQFGDVTIGRLGGSGELSTQKGDLTVTEAVEGTVTLHTGQGSISVGAASGTSASLDAGTSFGRIHNTLKDTGAGAVLAIHATTAHGDIAAHSL